MSKKKPDLYTYEECQEAVRKLNIRTKKEYGHHCESGKDPRLPTNPDHTYQKDWKSWVNFFDHTPTHANA